MKTLSLIVLTGLLALTACQTAPAPKPNLNAVTGDITQASSAITPAEKDVQTVKPLVPASGQPAIADASQQHAAAQASLAAGAKDLAAAQAQVTALEVSQAKAVAALKTIKNSWGYKLQQIVTRFVILLLVLVGIHLVGIVLGLFLPIPYGAIASVVAKVVNPLGWGIWLLTHFEGTTTAATPTRLVNAFDGGVANVAEIIAKKL